MQTSSEGAERSAPPTGHALQQGNPATLLQDVLVILEDAKAESVVTIDLKGKSSISDFMVIASGRSQRHVGAISDQIVKKLKKLTRTKARVEGLPHCDWVLIDVGDVIVHVFRPEVREFYNLEKMWAAQPPDEALAM